MELDAEAIPLVDSCRASNLVVLEHVALVVANLPVLADIDVRRREVASVARPRAVEAAHRIHDAVAARLHKGLGRQISRIKQIIQIPLIRRYPFVVAVVRVDLVEQSCFKIHYCWLRTHIRTRTEHGLVPQPVPLGPAPAVPDPAPVEGTVAYLLEGPVLRDDEELETLQPSPPPLDDAREGVRLEERVTVCVDNRGVIRAASMA